MAGKSLRSIRFRSIKMKGRVLISEPFMPDPTFMRSVVLVAEDDKNGTVGFVLNQQTTHRVDSIVEGIQGLNNLAYQGGPVELQSFHYIHNYKHIAGCHAIKDGIYWGGDFEQICAEIIAGTIDPKGIKFFVGYSGWATGQLEAELEEKSWIVGDLDAEHIFNQDIQDAELWKLAIRSKGGTDSLLANSPIYPNLN